LLAIVQSGFLLNWVRVTGADFCTKSQLNSVKIQIFIMVIVSLFIKIVQKIIAISYVKAY
jgi:hypothetical protein